MKSFLAGALVATIVSAGVTYAVASGSTDTVRACANKKTGDLRIMTGKKCKKSERRVSWPAGLTQAAQGATGAAGPKGDTGATGPAGQDGSAGVNGVSQIYTHSATGSYAPPGDGWREIEAFALPQGAFLLIFSIQVTFQYGDNHDATCRLKNVADATDSGLSLSARTSTSGSTLTIQNHYVLDEPDVVRVECISAGNSFAEFEVNNYAIATNAVGVYSPVQPCAHNDSISSAGC